MPFRDPEDRRRYIKAYNEEHREENREYQRLYRLSRLAELREYSRNYRMDHREELARVNQEYYELNKERIKARQRKYYADNRAACTEYGDRYRADPVNKRRAVERAARHHEYCTWCRNELRALVKHPTVAEVVDIDVERATDGQVRQFYDQLMEDLKNAKYQYTPKRKGRTAQAEKAS